MAKSFDSTTGEQTWITPASLQQRFGRFDLDPCAADTMPYRTADRMVTKAEDGLSFDWGVARVWLNPPYGKAISAFLERMRRGIALLPVRTDSRWFHELVVPRVTGLFLLRGRVRFLTPEGAPAGSPAFASMICPYTNEDADAVLAAGLDGTWFPCGRGGSNG